MLKNCVVKLVVSALLTLTPIFASAMVITLEPDDFGMGVPLENDYAKVTYTDGSPYSSHTAMTASKPGEWPGHKAPTGDMFFGNFALNSPHDTYGWSGMLILFSQAVSRVSLLANTMSDDELHSIASWIAFDRAGNEIRLTDRHLVNYNVPLGQAYEINMRHEGIWSVVLGGIEGTNLVYFDNLTFEIDGHLDASVPAPNPLILLMLGLAIITLVAKFRSRLNSGA